MSARNYHISASMAPGKRIPPQDTIMGGYAVGPRDAARAYMTCFLSHHYHLVTCTFTAVQDTEEHGLHKLWKVELHNHEEQIGATLWVREKS